MVISVLMWGAIGLVVLAVVCGAVGLIRQSMRPVAARLVFGALALGAAPTVSLAWTLVTDPEPILGSGANWARNHGLGVAVDRLELWWYSDPPSTEPAEQLDLSLPGVQTSTTVVTTTVATTTVATSATTTVPTGLPWTSTVPPATVFEPVDLVAVVEPALDGEGEWLPIADPGSDVGLWATAIRPLPDFPSVTATAVALDPESVRFVLHNGTELPGGSWAAGPRLDLSVGAGAVAAFNGGFRFEHIEGGYVTEGVVVEPLAEGEATIAIDADGRLQIGVWGDDIDVAGGWVSVRQSLPPIVRGGENMVRGTWAELWGVDYGNVTFVFRSAVCQGPRGELIYAVAGDVDGALMADVMISLGCETAMQLDINGNWPQFAVVDEFGSEEPGLRLVDRRMSNQGRYANGSKKDFIGVYVR